MSARAGSPLSPEMRGVMASNTSMNVLAILRSPQLAETVNAAIKQIAGATMTVRIGDIRSLGAAALQGGRPDVLIVDLDAEDAAELASLSQLMRAPENRTMWTLATAHHATVATMRRLL